ncbi:MAG: hypothetical protein H7257_06490 [Taibaiella sp.]|nr:hypothetical protein [Taibaiella sp.]
MKVRNIYIAICIVTTGLISCNDLPPKTHGSIKLGDPATIVTETDPARLQDLVTDLKPEIPPAKPPATDTPKTVTLSPVSGDTAKKATNAATAVTKPPPPPAAVMPAGAGLTAAFKEITVHIPGLSAKLSGKADLTKANGAVYTWQQGRIAGN